MPDLEYEEGSDLDLVVFFRAELRWKTEAAGVGGWNSVVAETDTSTCGAPPAAPALGLPRGTALLETSRAERNRLTQPPCSRTPRFRLDPDPST